MRVSSVVSLVFVTVIFIVFCPLTFSTPVEVGTGENSTDLYIEWSDGYIAEFLVHFDTASITGLEMFDIVEAQTTLTTERGVFGEDVFIDGIAFDGHNDSGYDGDENWWHYWIKDAGQTEWVFPAYGVCDRVLYDGYADGWIYGRAGPVPEPGTLALMTVVGLFIRMKRH
ncbi:MAG: PEP-CTERM sorting domain-containing protein [Planctomycetota bacterium]|jgi:hypothetical protein